ncbi:hypothetical protein J2Z40_002383 [Cytobacillus eiseniae]|uniref:DUF2812 domain-containing protein n=1 Tax=Cytobacillus eiseniae TaxID=762947 RepID=A0ABS4RHA8_9BACI|nr:DUF2812 domain-containing protein [Cytobacillus eiseniae]MBP2241811.1 hypothetical protein [Cytobacillus eiseniae]
MKKVMYRLYLDYEKEEKWINEMAAQGWNLEKFSLGRFTFSKGEPKAFIFRNEFIMRMPSNEKKEYFELLNDSGITIVKEFGGWIYMKKPADQGPFELYTDSKSRLSYYKGMLNVFYLLFLLNVVLGISNLNLFDDRTTWGYLNPTVGSICLVVSLLLLFPIIKIVKRKKSIEKQQGFFE